MIDFSKVSVGKIHEWMCLIDPNIANIIGFEEKIPQMIKEQTRALLSDDKLNEVRGKYWVLSKRRGFDGKTVGVDFALIAYTSYISTEPSDEELMVNDEARRQRMEEYQVELNKALQAEDYPKAAEIRDRLVRLGSPVG